MSRFIGADGPVTPFISTDGWRWWVGRRWLAWRPRPSRALRWCRRTIPNVGRGSVVDGAILFLVAMACALFILVVLLRTPMWRTLKVLLARVLLIPVAMVAWVPLTVAHLLDWAAALAATPFALFGRVALDRPWPVVAYVDGTVTIYHDGTTTWYTEASLIDYGDTGEYRGTAESAEAADELVTQVGAEITRYGAPRSLAPPEPESAPLDLLATKLEPAGNPIRGMLAPADVEIDLDAAPEWVRRGIRWFQLQLIKPPKRAATPQPATPQPATPQPATPQPAGSQQAAGPQAASSQAAEVPAPGPGQPG